MTKIAAHLTLLVTLTFVTSPFWTEPFSGFRADQLPIPQINPPVQPAGYAFAIWGLIYSWLVVSSVFGLWKRAETPGWNRARWPLIISLALGTPWLAIANESAVWATLMIFVMAATAALALLRAPAEDQWLFGVPVGIYAGWLTAASFVSLGSTAAGFGLLMDATGWAYLCIIGALVLGVLTLIRSGSVAYGLTLIWALVGIMVANGTAQIAVAILAGAGVAVIAGVTLLSHATARNVPS